MNKIQKDINFVLHYYNKVHEKLKICLNCDAKEEPQFIIEKLYLKKYTMYFFGTCYSLALLDEYEYYLKHV